MRFKLKKVDNTIEAVVTEDQRVVGVIGMVEDLMRAQLVEHAEGEEAPEDEKQKWMLAFEDRQFLGESKEDLLKLLKETVLLELYEHADKACQVRQNLIRRLRDVESWIAWSRGHGSEEWNDSELLVPGKNGDYWVATNEDGVRTVKVATYIGDWIVGEAEIVEAWKPIEEEPDPYVREEEKG